MMKLKGLSLFANIGVAEIYLKELGVEISLANELLERRVKVYRHLYPETEIIVGDITKNKIKDLIIKKSIQHKIDFIIATPPCQGMSLAGTRDKFDQRNQLISYAVDVIKKVKPRYVFLENVPQQLKTKIKYNNELILIPEYLKKQLKKDYSFSNNEIVRCMDYSIPQIRARNIILLTRKDQKINWEVPEKDKKTISLREAIGHLPTLDPFLREGTDRTVKIFPKFNFKKNVGNEFSKFHFPPTHSERHVIWMMHTPSGKTAFDNKIYFPQKADGTRIKGHYNTYRRHSWDKPSRSIIMNNGVISSLCCVHPGRVLKDSNDENKRLYSDPRVLSLAEVFIVFSIPLNWNIPDWENESFIRRVVGEGIPPLLVKKIFKNLIDRLK